MLRCILREKIQMATVTNANVAYEGSITIEDLFAKNSENNDN
jgi:aspartate 1-decarboxylase